MNEHTYMSTDFTTEVDQWMDTQYYDKNVHKIQLPYTPVSVWIVLFFKYCVHFLKGGVNPEIMKTIARCNFLIITVMYIKVYISGMEMSQRIRF